MAQIEIKVSAAGSTLNSGVRSQEILPEQPFNLVEAEKILAESNELKELNEITNSIENKVKIDKYDSIENRDLEIKEFEKITKEADKLYNEIRNNTEDINTIHQLTGIPKDILTCVKDHVFYSVHRTHNGISRFDPSIDMASAWLRLKEGNYAKSDLIWLKHEYAESLIMRGTEIPWREAHDFVNKYYNWDKIILGK